MAENEIDKLSLSIDVKDHDSAKKILQVSNAIRNLTNSLKGLDKVSAQIKSLQSVFAGVGAISRASSRSVAGGKNVLQKGILPDDSYGKGNLPPIGSKGSSNTQGLLPSAKEYLEGAKLVSEQTKILKDGTQQVVKVYEELKDGFKTTTTVVDGLVKSTKKVTVAQDEAGKTAKKTTGFFGSFVKSIGRIALYRAIRTALKEITQAMTEGIQNYAKYNAETNQAMSGVMNATNQLKNSLGVTVGSIMQSLAPILESLAGMATDLFNNINMALASLQGKNTYSKAIKQNEDYAKSLDKVNGKLLSFDTFNTLATDNGAKGLFEEVEISSEMNETANFLKEVFGVVKELFGVLKDVVSLVIELFEYVRPQIENVLQFVSGVIQQVRGVIQVIRGILKIFTGDFDEAFDLIGKGFENMLKGALNAFRGLLNSIIDGINFIWVKLNPLAWIFGAFGVDISIPHIPQFANGGSFNSADMFYANENGNTELIASSNRGGAVMNMEQLQSAIYNGMILAMAQDGGKEIVLKVDNNTLGKVVANSTGFISETNRRNSSLKLV